MAREAFRDEEVVSLSERFVCILVDINKERKIAAGFRIKATPTVSLFVPKAPTQRVIEGFQPPEVLVEEMRKVLKMVDAQASKTRI